MKCKKLEKNLTGDEWTLGKLAGLSAENFCTWDNMDILGYGGHAYLTRDKGVNFERVLWFELGRFMWRKHWSVYQVNMKYIRNDIVKHFKVKIIRYAKCVCEMHNLAKYLPPPLMKG